MFSFCKINSYLSLIKKAKSQHNNIKRIINKNRYIGRGKYYIFKTLKGFIGINSECINNEHAINFISDNNAKNVGGKTKFEKFLFNLEFKPVFKRQASNNFNGNIICLTAHSKREMIISLDKGQVMHHFFQKEIMQQSIHDQKLFSSFFPVISKISVNNYEGYYIEPFIRNEKIDFYDGLSIVYNYLLKIISQFPPTSKIKYPSNIVDSLLGEAKKRGQDFYKQCKNYIYSSDFKLTIQHGDMNLRNIIKNKNDYFVIDLDTVHNGIFYMDFINFISHSHKRKEFDEGLFNDMLFNLFERAGVNYNSNNNYMYWFCAEYLYMYTL